MYDLLKNINSPADVKKLSVEQLNLLASEIREALFNRLTKIGGHFGPNFGFVEATIALHYVFNSPADKFVFDVSHQSYTHKMLTGRKFGYIDETRFKEDSGYSNPEESLHDLFNIGHTSTSISLATGLAKARDIVGGTENVIAVIGDGSLSGGEALEGLSVAGSEIRGNLIIVVNDNQQSISETHGGIYKNLAKLRETNGKAADNMFTAWGLDYVYEARGNDIAALIDVFAKVKDSARPVVVHINTQKGKGYALAEQNKEAWHWCMPFDRQTGLPTVAFDPDNYVNIAKKTLLDKAVADKKVVIVTPNMPGSFGLKPDERQQLGERYVDVGIAEEQAVAMASGIAKRGLKPVVITNTTFLQRAYDQISQDVCINNSAVTFLLNYAAFDGLTDVTHLGIFGLSLFSNIPNLVVIAPSSREELIAAINNSIDQSEHPTLILLPGNKVASRTQAIDIACTNTYEVTHAGKDVAVLALGDFYQRGETLVAALADKLNVNATLVNPRFAAVDKATLDKLCKNHKVFVTLEDGILDGGFGQKVASYLGDKGVLVKNYGLDKRFYDRYNPAQLLVELGMDTDSMVADVEKLLRD